MVTLMRVFNYRKMATISESFSEIKTFIFLDTETTGLPFYENNKSKITELCLTAVQANHLRLGVFPRVQNKLSLCFNPRKLISAESEHMTGLSNDLLEHCHRFSEETVHSINNFLDHNPQPACFVAHNGFKFDYPLLRREIELTNKSLNENLLCIDTLLSFRELLKEDAQNMDTDDIDTVDNASGIGSNSFICEAQRKNETTPIKQIIRSEHNYPLPKKMKINPARKALDFGPSYKLGDVFSRLLKKEPIKSHQAEGDVQMLIMCAAHLGDKFVDWCNANTRKFQDIPAMVPGKRIDAVAKTNTDHNTAELQKE